MYVDLLKDVYNKPTVKVTVLRKYNTKKMYPASFVSLLYIKTCLTRACSYM